ncbi:MAG: alanine--tRNA ligase [Candidatus Peregrinibacteria bacterium]
MKPLSTDDIRQTYLDFFAAHGHAIIPGASLIPENDPTVLFTTAGMHPLVPYLLGEQHPEGTRLADVQRCIRTQDIEEVGDESHLTLLEMLGRWSLGDYFKEGAITMSFEFLTQALGIPRELLAVTCFAGDVRFPALPRDDASAAIWKRLGIPEERIGFLEGGVAESKKNWWGPAGKTGPCGPDTEMFFWVGQGSPRGNPATHEQEWLEIGNDVLMQYRKTEEETFEPLQKPNVDEGLGLDRLAWVLQRKSGARNVYETDRMKPIFDRALALAQNRTDADAVHHARIITDHLRAACFIVADGITPSNVDQGYVLRRLIRRAIRSARQLGLECLGTFTPVIAGEVIAQYGHVYGHLKTQERILRETLSHEEQQFGRSLCEGLKQFEKVVNHLSGSVIDGQSAFHLYDTYGFPIELTKEMASEKGLKIDEEGFRKAFQAHQDLSRTGAEGKFKGGLQDHSSQTTKLHTATHLLNAALRNVLGDHVFQKGSNITAERLRFDFSHGEKMTEQQIREVERLVNEAIQANTPIHYQLMTVAEAKKEGAIGVFENKYGETVKVYRMGPSTRSAGSGQAGSGRGEWPDGPFSLEICGGPHVARTGMLGSFKILKEEASSAGVRRIKAIVGGGPEEIETAREVSELQ